MSYSVVEPFCFAQDRFRRCFVVNLARKHEQEFTGRPALVIADSILVTRTLPVWQPVATTKAVRATGNKKNERMAIGGREREQSLSRDPEKELSRACGEGLACSAAPPRARTSSDIRRRGREKARDDGSTTANMTRLIRSTSSPECMRVCFKIFMKKDEDSQWLSSTPRLRQSS